MKKFKLSAVSETTSKTVRFPQEIIAGVEHAICGTNVTFPLIFCVAGPQNRPYAA